MEKLPELEIIEEAISWRKFKQAGMPTEILNKS